MYFFRQTWFVFGKMRGPLLYNVSYISFTSLFAICSESIERQRAKCVIIKMSIAMINIPLYAFHIGLRAYTPMWLKECILVNNEIQTSSWVKSDQRYEAKVNFLLF